MNPQYPFPNPPFNFDPINPSPNPNPNPFFPHSQFNSWVPPPPPPPPPPAPAPPPQTPFPDLPTSLSSLQNLLSLARSALHSFSSVLPSLSPSSYSLVQCPSNPHHWVSPSSLFLHSLHCPSPLDVGPLLDTLQYPKTLKSEQQLIEQNKFVQPLPDPAAELCFSLDDYVDFHSNFFYHDCPGVVSSINDDATHNRIFSLPGSLSVECANFVSNGDRELYRLQGNCVKVLPSEIWVVRCEVEQWNDYPNEYSYSVLRALLCLEFIKECDLSMWVIVNSLRYGIVVDVPMSDHMLVLFKFCMKAMVREAAQSYRTWSYRTWSDRNTVNNSGQLNAKSSSFKCPVLVGVLKWLSLQLSILYGETNAKLFAIAMLKHWLPNAASYASLFPLGKETDQISGDEQGSSVFRDCAYGKSVENEGGVRAGDKLFCKSIFVYQIAAAIAALLERSLLEERIKALRNPLPLTTFQRNAEHAYLSKKASEERHKRHNYRALIEHDGLPSQKQHDQDTDKAKTREELLAEERDYKRRRMSYRGKKLKRTTKEVMRDIIEDYMEAIKQAGGIGCLAKGDGKSFSTQKTSSAHDTRNFKPSLYSKSDQQDGNMKPLHNEYNFKDAKSIDDSPSRNEHQKYDHYSQRHFEDQGTAHKDRYDRHYLSRSPSRDGRHGRSRENRSHRRNSGVTEMYEDDHSKSYHSSDRFRHSDRKLSHSTSISSNISSGRKDKRKLEYTDRHRQQRNNDKSEFIRRGELNDRYDPSEASDIYKDEFDDSKYMRPAP